eukprot:2366083-Amphidinium_carterae.1
MPQTRISTGLGWHSYNQQPNLFLLSGSRGSLRNFDPDTCDPYKTKGYRARIMVILKYKGRPKMCTLCMAVVKDFTPLLDRVPPRSALYVNTKITGSELDFHSHVTPGPSALLATGISVGHDHTLGFVKLHSLCFKNSFDRAERVSQFKSTTPCLRWLVPCHQHIRELIPSVRSCAVCVC